MPTVSAPVAAPVDVVTGWDHLELWVGNARAFSHFLAAAFGFDVVAYAGPETGQRERASYVLEQGSIRLLVTSALRSDSPVADHVRAHGDGVRTIALGALDVDEATAAAARRGATVVEQPGNQTGDAGTLRSAAIATYGDTWLRFVDRSSFEGRFAPGFSEDRLPVTESGGRVGLERLDHIVGNVEAGRLDAWVNWYEDVMGFAPLRHFDADQISTEYSALRSTVVWDGHGIVLPLNEPARGRGKSQIQEYLEAYGGPGVQHLALTTSDIVGAVDALRRRGVRFLDPPAAYYRQARIRCAGLDVPWTDLERLGILVDVDGDGYLLQVFTETLADRPTVFVEVIQREGARGFGEGNFKALFEAIELEQARRGNL